MKQLTFAKDRKLVELWKRGCFVLCYRKIYRRVSLNFFFPVLNRPPHMTKVFIGNLAFKTTDQDLQAYFEGHGEMYVLYP